MCRRSGFEKLPPSTAAQLLATLCAALKVLTEDLGAAMIEASQSESPADALLQQRNALLQYVFFIEWALTQGECMQAEAAESAAGGRGPCIHVHMSVTISPQIWRSAVSR